MGQLHALPRRSIAVCFTPVSGNQFAQPSASGVCHGAAPMPCSKQHLYSITSSAVAFVIDPLELRPNRTAHGGSRPSPLRPW